VTAEDLRPEASLLLEESSVDVQVDVKARHPVVIQEILV
jgi:hypothetical protein